MNLFSVEACRHKKDDDGRPTKNIVLGEQIIKLQDDLLYKTLLKLKPKTLIFLTGKSLDDYLKTVGINNVKCKWVSIDDNEVLFADNLCEIKISDIDHPLYDTKIVRAYHPSYFMGQINGFKRLNKKLEKKGIPKNLSEYYCEVLYSKIQDLQKCS